MAAKYKGGRNGKRRVQHNALSIHFLHHAKSGNIGHQTAHKGQGGNSVHAKSGAQTSQGFVQNFGNHKHQRKRTGKGHAGVGTNKDRIFIGIKFRTDDSLGQECKNSQHKTCNRQHFHQRAECPEALHANLRCANQRNAYDQRENQQRQQIDQQRTQRQFAHQSGNKAAHRNGGNTAKKAEQQILVLTLLHHAQRNRQRERDDAAHHGRDHKSVIVANILRHANALCQCHTSHIVCQKRHGNDGRIYAEEIIKPAAERRQQNADRRGDDNHTKDGQCHRTKQRKRPLKFAAHADLISQNIINSAQHRKNKDHNGDGVHSATSRNPLPVRIHVDRNPACAIRSAASL